MAEYFLTPIITSPKVYCKWLRLTQEEVTTTKDGEIKCASKVWFQKESPIEEVINEWSERDTFKPTYR